MPPERHVILVHPEVHWNTGNAGRTCLGAGAFLHLIRPLGFSLSDKMIRRAGLDYWNKVKLRIWDDLPPLLDHYTPSPDEIALLTKNGAEPYWSMPRSPRLFLFFGAESDGLPDSLLNRFPNSRYRIPITEDIRCLNLSTSVGIVLYDTLRPFRA